MTEEIPRKLLDQGFISEDQYSKIHLISSGKIVSVFYELRSLLYLGVLLFTSGAGILIYKNIGEFGHVISIIVLILLTIACFWYVYKKAPAYSNSSVISPTPYFDYIVLLGALLFISVQGYLQFQFGIFDENLGLSTLVTSAFFFYVAYRFDHAGILSLAITALASFWSISISPQKWYSGNFLSSSNLHNTAIVFSTVVAVVSLGLDKKAIKTHFTFTYLNFCSLIFFIGAIAGLFIGNLWGVYLLLIYSGCVFTFYVARWKKSFLFLIYAFISAYIGTTYLLARTVLSEAIELWFLYSIVSCGGFIYFIVSFKNYFKQKS